jgi:hypothetical protein
MGFFVVVAIGFASCALYALGLATDYHGWRTAHTRRWFPSFDEDDALARAVDIFGQVVAWIVVAAGVFAFTCSVVAILRGS